MRLPSSVPVLASAAFAAWLPAAASAAAQGHVVLQAGGARSLPGAEAVGDAALYGVGGATLGWGGDRTVLMVSLYGGIASDETTGADFGSAAVEGEAWSGSATAIGLTARAGGFQIRDPFTYRTSSIRGGPAARLRRGRVTATVRAEAGAGSTLVELRRSDGRVRRAERDLWSRGIDLDLSLRERAWAVEVAAGSWASSGGAFRRGGASVTWTRPRLALRVDGARWHTPLGGEWTGGVSVVVPVGTRGSLAGTAGRAPPDPLTLVEAGGQGGILAGWRIASFGGPPPPLARLRWEGGEATAAFRLDDDTSREAAVIEILGDFTGWAPAPMGRRGDAWIIELVVPTGVHHYGFRVDGEWYVPEGRPGNVADEWGRTNATLVVMRDDGGALP